MTIERVMPVLRVTDLDRAIAFYVERLGFDLAWRSPNDGGGEEPCDTAARTAKPHAGADSDALCHAARLQVAQPFRAASGPREHE